MVNSNYPNDLLSTTFEIFLRNKPADAIFGDIVLWKILKAKSRLSTDGGQKLLTPINYRKSTAIGSYDGWDQLDIAPQETITNAEFDWRQYYFTVAISGKEEMLNQGRGRMIKLLENKMNVGQTSLIDSMNADLFLDGTGNSNKALTGLAAMVLASGTYGNIARGTYTWWRANVTAVGGVLAVAGATGMRRMYNDCSLGRGRFQPNVMLTTQIIHEAYEALMDSNMRYSNTDDTPVTGDALKFKRANLYYDDYCQSGVMYFLNTEVIDLVTHSDRDDGDVKKEEDRDQGDFRMEPFQKPIGQDGRVAKAFWMGQLACQNPRFVGKLTGISNT